MALKRMASKYRAVRTTVDGIKFASKREARRYGELKLAQAGGAIRNLALQVPYDLVVNGQKVGRYVADFVYHAGPIAPGFSTASTVVEDVKGMKTPVYNLKKKLMKAIHGIEILETK